MHANTLESTQLGHPFVMPTRTQSSSVRHQSKSRDKHAPARVRNTQLSTHI